MAFINDTIASLSRIIFFRLARTEKNYSCAKIISARYRYVPPSCTENSSVSVKTTKTMRNFALRARLGKKGAAEKKRKETERTGRVVASAVTALTAVNFTLRRQ